MKKLSYFLSGVLATVLVFALMLPALAASGLTITVNTDMQIKVNGEVFKPKDAAGKDALVFEYNGTTYAPLRALAEAYGLEVGYDQDSRMATVGEPVKGSVTKIESIESIETVYVKLDDKYYFTYMEDNAAKGPSFTRIRYNGEDLLFSGEIMIATDHLEGSYKEYMYCLSWGINHVLQLALMEDYTISKCDNPYADGLLKITKPNLTLYGYLNAGKDEPQYISATQTYTPEWIEYNGTRIYKATNLPNSDGICTVDGVRYYNGNICVNDILKTFGIDKQIFVGKHNDTWYMEIK